MTLHAGFLLSHQFVTVFDLKIILNLQAAHTLHTNPHLYRIEL